MKAYMYLARRDKKEVKMLTAFPVKNEQYQATRVPDVKKLGLPDKIADILAKEINKEKMYWEPFVECSDNYGNLVKSLTKRGYGKIPMHFAPIHQLGSRFDENITPLISDPINKKTMLRKKG